MEETLNYNTPTSEKIIREINEFNFKKIWAKDLKKNRKNLIIGTAYLILGIIPILTEPKFIGTFIIGNSLACLGFYFNYRINFKKNKESFIKISDKEIESLNRNSNDVFWEYTPEYFRFKNYKQDLKFSWEIITYQIVE